MSAKLRHVGEKLGVEVVTEDPCDDGADESGAPLWATIVEAVVAVLLAVLEDRCADGDT